MRCIFTFKPLRFGYDLNRHMENFAGTEDMRRCDVQQAVLPSGLQSFTCGSAFDQRMENIAWPAGRQIFTLGNGLNHKVEKADWPSGLQRLTFGYAFHRCMGNGALPADLRKATFGDGFSRSMDEAALPVRPSVLATASTTAWRKLFLPASLQSLASGYDSNQHMGDTALTADPQSLTFSSDCDQGMDKAGRTSRPAELRLRLRLHSAWRTLL